MRKTKTLNEDTRERIIDAFWKLYKNNKIEKISIKEITDLAKVNRSTFYEYFKDIYDLLEYSENSLLQLYGDEPIHNDNIFEIIKDIYDTYGDKISILIGDNGDPSFINKLKLKLKNKFLYTELNNELLFEFYFSGLVSSFNYWYKNKDTISLDEFISTIHARILNNIFNDD